MPLNGPPEGCNSQSPLLEDAVAVAGAIDHNGLPAKRSTSGGWRSAYFIIGTEVAERCAYSGIDANLVNYLTGPLGQSTAMAAKNVNAWFGTTTLLPLLGAFVADSYMGRYRTIIIASLLYILALGLLSMSATLSSHNPHDFQHTQKVMSSSSPSQLQVILFFLSIYLVAVAEGGHKPCTQAFGADQFDGEDPKESKAKSSYFNWLNFSLSIGLSVGALTLSYVQDNINWVVGFGIPCIILVVALLIFLAGTKTYRYSVKREENNAFSRISRVFVEAARNWRLNPSGKVLEEGVQGTLSHQCSPQFKFLNKALLGPKFSEEGEKACSINEVEEAKAILRLFPIWSTCLIHALVLAQSSTFFIKQGTTMDRSIGSGFDVPSASLKSIVTITSVLSIPIYDLVFVPIATVFTRNPSGITMLQRVGIGMFLSTISMAIAALVEMKRVRIAQEHGLVDMPNATIPMRIWWLVPQYVLFGLSYVFAFIGLQEFFYDQVPKELRSIGISLSISISGMGSFLSSLLIYFLEKITGGDGQDSWFSDNLNKAHLDYFYWLLFGLNALGLVAYMHFARSYIYNRRGVL